MKRVVVGFLTLALHTPLFAGQMDGIVSANYPSCLSGYASLHHLMESRTQSYAVIDAKDARFVVAAYSNAHAGAVVLLERTTGDSYAPIQTICGRHLQGDSPNVKLLDVDGDGIPEAIVRFSLPRGAQTWVYRLRNGQLKLISPTTANGASLLAAPKFVDLGDSGVRDIIEPSSGNGSDDTESYAHYALVNDKYAISQPVEFYAVFYRDRHSSNEQTIDFEVPATDLASGGSFVLTAINGDSAGPDFRVARAIVILNGTTLIADKDLPEHTKVLSLQAPLQQSNTISVTLGGGEKGRVGIIIVRE